MNSFEVIPEQSSFSESHSTPKKNPRPNKVVSNSEIKVINTIVSEAVGRAMNIKTPNVKALKRKHIELNKGPTKTTRRYSDTNIVASSSGCYTFLKSDLRVVARDLMSIKKEATESIKRMQHRMKQDIKEKIKEVEYEKAKMAIQIPKLLFKEEEASIIHSVLMGQVKLVRGNITTMVRISDDMSIGPDSFECGIDKTQHFPIFNSLQDTTISLDNKLYIFDKIIQPGTSQSEIFDILNPYLKKNFSLILLGLPGSGKLFTCFGPRGLNMIENSTTANSGIAIRVIEKYLSDGYNVVMDYNTGKIKGTMKVNSITKIKELEDVQYNDNISNCDYLATFKINAGNEINSKNCNIMIYQCQFGSKSSLFSDFADMMAKRKKDTSGIKNIPKCIYNEKIDHIIVMCCINPKQNNNQLMKFLTGTSIAV